LWSTLTIWCLLFPIRELLPTPHAPKEIKRRAMKTEKEGERERERREREECG
jgi:hypothetical protein